MTAFSLYLLVAGGLALGAGWVLLLVTVSRMVRRRRLARSRVLPARRTTDAFVVGRVELPRAAGVRGPARGRVVADVQAAVAATTLLLPAATTPVGGGYRAGQAPPRTWPAHSSRLSDAVSGASGRVWVPAPGRGCGAGTPQAVPGRAFERGARPGTHQLPVRAMPRAYDDALWAGHERGRVYAPKRTAPHRV